MKRNTKKATATAEKERNEPVKAILLAVMIPPDWFDFIESDSKTYGMSRSAYVRSLISEEADRQDFSLSEPNNAGRPKK